MQPARSPSTRSLLGLFAINQSDWSDASQRELCIARLLTILSTLLILKNRSTMISYSASLLRPHELMEPGELSQPEVGRAASGTMIGVVPFVRL